MKPILSRKAASTGLLLVVAAFVGGLAAWQPLPFTALALVGALIALPMLRLIWQWPFYRVALLLLVIVHFTYIMRHTWFDTDYVPAFKYLRLPALFVLPIAGLFGGFRTVLNGPAKRITILALAYGLLVFTLGSASNNPSHTMFYSAWLVLVIVNVAVVVASYEQPGLLWRDWTRGILAISFVACAGSLLAISTGADLVRSDRWILGSLEQAWRGLFFNPNVLGGQGLVLLATTVAYQKQFPETRRVVIWGALLVSGIIVIASASRGCFLGWAIGAGLLVFQGGISQGIGLRRLLLRLALLSVFLIPLAGTATNTLTRLASTATSVNQGEEARVTIWRHYIERTIERPIVGSGFNTSALEGDYVGMRSVLRAHSPHSVLIQYVVGPGIPAGLLFLVLLFLAGRGLFPWSGDPLRTSILSFMLILSPQLLGSTLTGPRDWGVLLFWVPLILAGSLEHRRRVYSSGQERHAVPLTPSP